VWDHSRPDRRRGFLLRDGIGGRLGDPFLSWRSAVAPGRRGERVDAAGDLAGRLPRAVLRGRDVAREEREGRDERHDSPAHVVTPWQVAEKGVCNLRMHNAQCRMLKKTR
jgi:hypothetical protein